MKLTTDILQRIVGGVATGDRLANMNSIVAGLDAYGAQTGLDQPWRLAHFLAQMGHESGGFMYDREVWGNTKAQRGYEGRADLGNTQPGDGYKFRGRTGTQVTGRENTRQFRDWCRDNGLPAPDFEDKPDLMNTDPWEGLGPIWYWTTRNLNRYADDNNIEMITRKINGGLNGYEDRQARYVRTALVLLGYRIESKVIAKFQADAGIMVDDVAGPATRNALHLMLRKMALPAAIPVPTPRPDPIPVLPAVVAPPVTGGLPAVIGSVSKAIGAAKGAAKGSAVLPAIALIAPKLGILPAWIFEPEYLAAIFLVFGVLSAAIWSFISTYKAPPNTTTPPTV